MVSRPRRRPAGGARQPARRDALRRARCCSTDVDDHPGNQTRFVWLARAAEADAVRARVAGDGAAKTSIVFWGAGDGSPGWLVSCLAELSDARHQPDADRVAAAADRPGPLHVLRRLRRRERRGTRSRRRSTGLRARCEEVRVLGSYRGAERAPVVHRTSAVRASALATLAPARCRTVAVSPPARSASPDEHRRRGRDGGRVLVLNATYEPINVCTVRRAVVLLLKARAEVLEEGAADAALRATRRSRGRS